MSWNRKYYHPSSYHSFNINQIIQETGRTLTNIGVADIYLTIQAPKGHYYDIILIEVLHCPILFTNLILASYLQKKGWYLYKGTKTLNRCNNNFQITSTSIKNDLYIL